MPERKYIVLCGQVINTEHGFGTSYWSDDERFETREEAIKNGFKLRGSDDFNIGVLDDGKLVSLDWMDEPVDTDPGVLAGIEQGGWS